MDGEASSYLREHVLQLNDLRPELLLGEELLGLHLLNLAHVRVLAVLQHRAVLLQLRLQLNTTWALLTLSAAASQYIPYQAVLRIRNYLITEKDPKIEIRNF